MRAATVVQQLCKSCSTCFKFYCMFYFTCDRSLNAISCERFLYSWVQRQTAAAVACRRTVGTQGTCSTWRHLPNIVVNSRWSLFAATSFTVAVPDDTCLLQAVTPPPVHPSTATTVRTSPQLQ